MNESDEPKISSPTRRLLPFGIDLGIHANQLYDAWHATNLAAHGLGLRVHELHRLAASVDDVIVTMHLAQELAAVVTERWVKLWTVEEALPLEYRAEFRGTEDYREQMLCQYRYAAVVKALFFFVRAFLDCSYAVLLRAQGEMTGRKTSLAKGLNNPRGELRESLEKDAPGFVEWFLNMRDTRNSMKLGIAPGGGIGWWQGRHSSIELTLGEVTNDSPPAIMYSKRLRVSDIDECVQQAARFMAFVKNEVERRADSPNKASPPR